MCLVVGRGETGSDDMFVGLALGRGIEVSHKQHNVLWRLHFVINPTDGSLYLVQPNLIIRDRVMQVGIADMKASPILENEL